MNDIIKPTNLMPAEIIPSGFTPSELTPDAMNKINTKIAIIIGTIVALIAILILAALFIKNGKEYLQDKRRNEIKDDNKVKNELNNEINTYQNQIYYCCGISKNQINIADNALQQLINNRREKLDQKYKISISTEGNEDYIKIQDYQITFCENKFEEAINQFNKIKQLRNKNNSEINKILLDLLKHTGNTQSLFEVYRGEGTVNLLNIDKQGEYVQNTNLNIIQHNLLNKYQEKITKALGENKFDEANKIVKIFKMLGYYERVTNFAIRAKNQNEFIGIIKGTYPKIKNYEFSDEFISKFQKVLKDEYFYSLIDLKFEYREKIADLGKKGSTKLTKGEEETFDAYIKIYNDLKIVIENIIQSNPEYANLKDLTKEEFQKEDNKNFEQTLKFIDKNEIVERMNEMMNPLKNTPGNNVNLGRGGMGQEH